MATSNLALDLILKSLLSEMELTDSSDDSHNKLMSVISKIIPGTTAYKCERRLEELRKDIRNVHDKSNKVSLNTNHKEGQENGGSQLNDIEIQSISSTDDKDSTSKNSSIQKSSVRPPKNNKKSGEYGPSMVIHVFDEGRKIKKDFFCPRELLLDNMQYFTEYLTREGIETENIDISVHCDLEIFDWLLRYVKIPLGKEGEIPKLEPGRVVSILISSDFLKIDKLVAECIRYCHDHMNDILATSCNMNCIEERLVDRIAESFTAQELNDVIDRKEKFKDKLFGRKVVSLLNEAYKEPNNSGKLFKCSLCGRILNKKYSGSIRCLPNRVFISNDGTLAYRHTIEMSFDVNDWLIELKSDRSWCDVYWIVLSVVNFLLCTNCGEMFQCCDISSCICHPKPAVYERKDGPSAGFYPCCGKKVVRFDPSAFNSGCRTRDHVYEVMRSADRLSANVDMSDNSTNQQLYQQLLNHRDVISDYYNKFSHSSSTSKQSQPMIELFTKSDPDGMETMETNSSCFTKNYNKIRGEKLNDNQMTTANNHINDIRHDDDDDYSDDYESTDDDDDDDDDSNDTDYNKTNKVLGAKKKSTSVKNKESNENTTVLNNKSVRSDEWDKNKSLRYNQDSQREADQRCMKEILSYLNQLSHTENTTTERSKQIQFSGGLYSRLENQWKQKNSVPSSKPHHVPIRTKSKTSLNIFK